MSSRQKGFYLNFIAYGALVVYGYKRFIFMKASPEMGEPSFLAHFAVFLVFIIPGVYYSRIKK